MKWVGGGGDGEDFGRSLPVRGAWVEMTRARRNTPPPARRSPCGERGLKCVC